MTSQTSTALALALASLCTVGIAAAQPQAARGEATTEAQLQAARADLERAARRVAELSRLVGRADEPIRIEKRADGSMRLEGRVARRPVLGVLLAPDAQGVRVAGVTPDGGAASSGLRAGDRITGIDGQKILGTSGELRVENARKLLSDLDAKTPVKVTYVRDGRTTTVNVTPKLDEQLFVLHGPEGGPIVFEGAHPPGVAPRIRSEVYRIGPRGDCKGKDCKLPVFAEAFRWSGLNLASVDRALGRYFGTDRGVLVLSTGELSGLQAGDVIHKIDGKAVDTPREAMDLLREKPADALVLVEYLRDRKAASARVRVPKAMPLRIPPPPPPAPPAPPAAPKAPPAPPAPPAAAGLDGTAVLREVRIAYAPEAPAALPSPASPAAPLPPVVIEDVEILQAD